MEKEIDYINVGSIGARSAQQDLHHSLQLSYVITLDSFVKEWFLVEVVSHEYFLEHYVVLILQILQSL